MSPSPSRRSAPIASRMVRESMREVTWNEMRAGKFALMRPVMTSTDGRWVARIRWMPAARAFCASRVIDSSTSRPTVIMRSASSSMMMTMRGRCSWTSGASGPTRWTGTNGVAASSSPSSGSVSSMTPFALVGLLGRDQLVVAVDVADALLAQHAIAAVHLAA